jgi:hypothetical protein
MSIKRRYMTDDPYCFELKRTGSNLTIIAGQERKQFYADVYSLASSSEYIRGRFSAAFSKSGDETLDLTRFKVETVRQLLIIHYYEAKNIHSNVFERFDELLELAGFLLHVGVIMFLLWNSYELSMHEMFTLIEKHNIALICGEEYAEWEDTRIKLATPEEVRRCLDKESTQGKLYEKHMQHFMKYAIRHESKKLNKKTKIRSMINKVIKSRTGKSKMIRELSFDWQTVRTCQRCKQEAPIIYTATIESGDGMIKSEYWCQPCMEDYAFLVQPE